MLAVTVWFDMITQNRSEQYTENWDTALVAYMYFIVLEGASIPTNKFGQPSVNTPMNLYFRHRNICGSILQTQQKSIELTFNMAIIKGCIKPCSTNIGSIVACN